MVNIDEKIAHARRFGEQAEVLVLRRGQCEAKGDRDTLLAAYWSLAFDFHKGVLSLLSAGFFGSAFALVRPILETAIRSHIAIMGSDEEVSRLMRDEYIVNFSTIGPRIDSYFQLEDLFENLLNSARRVLHSYTHAGTLQLGRRFRGTDIIPNYGEGAIGEVIDVSTSAVFLVNNVFTKHLGFEEEWAENTKLYLQWGKKE